MKLLRYIKLTLIASLLVACSVEDVPISSSNPKESITSKKYRTREIQEAIDSGNRNKTSNTAFKNPLTIQTILSPPANTGCNELPTLNTNNVVNIGQFTSTFTTRLVSNGTNCSVSEYGHIYIKGNDANITLNTNNIEKRSYNTSIANNALIITALVNLIPNTIYTQRAYAKNTKGIQYSDAKTFTTQAVVNTGGCITPMAIGRGLVSDPNFSGRNLFPDKAIIEGEITDFGNNCIITEYGHILVEGHLNTLTLQTTGVMKQSKIGQFTGSFVFFNTFTGLKSKTNYTKTEFVTTEKGTVYTAVLKFTTP